MRTSIVSRTQLKCFVKNGVEQVTAFSLGYGELRFHAVAFVPKKPSFHSDACSEASHVEVGGRDANLVRHRQQARGIAPN
jgi:hypothetical protein